MTSPAPPDIGVWPPYCGEEYKGSDIRHVAGWPMVCTRPVHGKEIQHCNEESGFRWWG